VWHQLSNDEEEVVIIGTSPPQAAQRDDLVFMEVWLELVDSSDVLHKFGFDQSALDALDNEIMDPDLNIETSKRVQVQYRFRWVEGVDFGSYRNGLGYPGAYARGGLISENTDYFFTAHPEDPGLFRAGNGDSDSQTDLNTVDGYVYAIPVARVHRRNKETYSLSNQNGSNVSMLSGTDSDRPDKLFYDEIASKDVEDLRHKISLNGFDYNQLLEENLNLIWTRALPSELKRSPIDEDVVGNKMIQVDGISIFTRTGVDDNGRDPDGVKRAFSEAQEFQKISFSISNPSINDGKLWFTPIGHQDDSWEYELFDENKYYLRPISGDYEPLILEYNTALNTYSVISGGTWTNLGEHRTFSFLTGDKNKATFTPADLSQIQNKNIVIMFDFVVREGGGLSDTIGGFNYKIDAMLDGQNEKDGKIVEYNLYTENSKVTELDSPRVIGSLTDSALTRSIARFEDATNPSNTFDEIYRGATVEIKYHVLSTGSSSQTIPLTAYGRDVIGIYSVFNTTTSVTIIPDVEKTASGFEVTGLAVDTDDILEFTLLCGTYTVDYVPHTRGIRNVAKTYTFSDAINVGDTEGILNVKNVISSCDAVIANAGFFNGVENKFVAYVNNEMIFLDNIEGLGTPILKYTLADPSTVSGQIDFQMLGYYSPSTSDKMYFQYEYTPYSGILNTLLTEGDTQQVKILKMDSNITTSTAGTGSEDQKVPTNMKDMIGTLPINKEIREYNFFGTDIESPLSGAESSFKRVPGRGLSLADESGYLHEGQILDLKIGDEDQEMLRGVIIESPKVSERGYDLTTPLNHVTQWSALVEGLGDMKGELFTMIVTTASTVYNLDEGPEYEYLETKGLYIDEALGKGSETILDNNVSEIELTTKLGTKIIGAVDLYPLKNRPLIIPS